MTHPILQSLFAHQAWADEKIRAAVEDCPAAAEDSRARELLQHTYDAQRFFMRLARGESPQVAEFVPAGSIDELFVKWRANDAELAELLATITDERLAGRVEIPLPGRETFRVTVEQALLQAVTHSQYHRSQIAERIRKAGGTAPGTDILFWFQKSIGHNEVDSDEPDGPTR
jgi:uncharacterized damage-inducible protein DinB